MSTIHEPRRGTPTGTPSNVVREVHPDGSSTRARETGSQRALRYVGAVIRLSMGWIFLWAFLDKLFGLGHETPAEAAWLEGGQPTAGFLGSATAGPFAEAYQELVGLTWVDWVFMVGLAAIGIALLLGIGMRIAATAGAIMLVLMWAAVLPPANNPFMDDHLVYALVLVALALGNTGTTLGLGRWWQGTRLVQRFPVLV